MDANTINAEKTMRGGAVGVLGCIDQYEIVRELGEGGFGAVYLARDTVAGVEVAIKGLPPEVKHNRAEMENVKANFGLVSRLHHPYIAAALHLHLAKVTTYADTSVRDRLRVLPGDTMLVMEYAPGVTLDRWRKQFPGGVVPAELAVNIAWQVAQALDFAHENRILHRDVKPANVMIETLPDGSATARLLDFGLAAEIRSSMGRVSREIRDTSGTRPYMAPEQWAGRRQTAATDQYALAAMLYELVVGEVPFASVFETGDPVVMMTVVTNRPVEIPADSPRRRSFVKALSKDGADRYPSCVAFIQDFAKSEKPAEPDPAASRPPSQAPHPATILRTFGVRRLVAAAACILLVVAGVATYLSARRNRIELEGLFAQIAERRQAFASDYEKVDAYRSHVRTRETQRHYVSRLDDLHAEVESLVVSQQADKARVQLRQMDEYIIELQKGLGALASDEEKRLKAEEKARREAEEKARREAEEKARREAEEKAKRGQDRQAETTPEAETADEPSEEDVLVVRMKKLMLPTVSFMPPAKVSDAVSFFIGAGKDYDAPDLPIDKRGFNLVLDAGAVGGDASIPTAVRLSNISFYDALSTVCHVSGFKFEVENGVVWIRPKSKTAVTLVQTPKAPVKTQTSRQRIREETQMAKRCAQEADWPGCYEHLAQADTNDCEIMYLKGVCLSSLHPDKRAGVTKNDKRAFNWFLRGSKQGDAPCQQNLGEAYRKGLGIPKNLEFALCWIKQSAEKGNPYAVCSLAQMLEKGEGIAMDTEKAADLYALAAQKNVADAVRWVRAHNDTDRYKKMVAKATKSQPEERVFVPKSSGQGKSRGFSRASRAYDRDWPDRGGSWSSSRPSIGGGSGGSQAAVWGSVLGGVLTGLAIGLSAIH